MISAKPYVFERSYSKNGFSDHVVIGLNLPSGEKSIAIGDQFKDGEVLIDQYSGQKARVHSGQIRINTPFDVVLMAGKSK
jgi:alpha-amylase